MTPDDLRAQGLEFDPANGPQFYYERWCEALARIEELSKDRDDAYTRLADMNAHYARERERADEAEAQVEELKTDLNWWHVAHEQNHPDCEDCREDAERGDA